jgi:aspartate 1-decarboxylase
MNLDHKINNYSIDSINIIRNVIYINTKLITNFNINDTIKIYNNNSEKIVGFVEGYYNSKKLNYYGSTNILLSENDTVIIGKYIYIIESCSLKEIILKSKILITTILL